MPAICPECGGAHTGDDVACPRSADRLSRDATVIGGAMPPRKGDVATSVRCETANGQR